MSKVMAICNQKGRVGKTVTAVNLGIGLARQGKRVLLVDDIFTSGATCGECARALYRAGAESVRVFCLAAA